MKKLFLAVFVLLLLITGCSSKDSTLLKSQQAAAKFVSKDSFVLYISSSTCPTCLTYDPVYEEVSSGYKGVMYKLDYHSEVTKNKEAFNDFVISHIPFVNSTPTTLFVVDGSVVGTYVGIMKAAELSDSVKYYKIAK